MRGKAFRRYMAYKKKSKRIKILEFNYSLRVGNIDYGWDDGEWKITGKYVKYPRNSNVQKYLKRQSNRLIRRTESLPGGNGYRKYMEYKWELW